jgi:hypothetical protein
MSSLRSSRSSRSSFLARFATAVALVGCLSTAASAEIARVPPAGPPVTDHVRFAQPPDRMPHHPPVDPIDDIEPVLDRAAVREALVRARARNLAAFRAYQKAGVFPSNTYKDGRLNVWRDQDGHFCAAATIIRTSGQIDLVDRVADQNNFIRLADVTSGPLMDWILTSGFTQEEIAAIQEPFMPVVKHPQPVQDDPLVVDAKLRAAENARLRARYRVVDRMLARNAHKSLELAVDRLMKHPDLAWKIASAE